MESGFPIDLAALKNTQIATLALSPTSDLAKLLSLIKTTNGNEGVSLTDGPFAIAPGDSAAIVTAKIKAFTLSTILELIDTLPFDSVTKKSLGNIFSSLRETTPENSVHAYTNHDSATHASITNSETQSATTQPHALSLNAMTAMQTIFEVPTGDSTIKAVAALMQRLVDQNNSSTLQSLKALQQMIAAQDNSISSSVPNDAISPKLAKAVIENLLASQDVEILQNATHWNLSTPRVTTFSANDWKLIARLSENLVEMPEINSASSLDRSLNPLFKESSRQSPNSNFQASFPAHTSKDDFKTLAQQVFFAPNQITNDLKSLTPDSTKYAREILNAASAGSGLAQSVQVMGSNASSLQAMASMLAARLVVAYRLAPGVSNTNKLKNKRYTEQTQSSSWLLRFALSEMEDEDNLEALIEQDKKSQAFTVKLAGGNSNSQARLAQQGQSFTDQMGFNWLRWCVQ